MKRSNLRIPQTFTTHLLAAIVGLAASACVSGNIPPRPDDGEGHDAADIANSDSGKPLISDSGKMKPIEMMAPDSGMMKPIEMMALDGGMTKPIEMMPPNPESGMTTPMGATKTCPPSTETNACFKCSDEYCCEEGAACREDARCGLFYKTCVPQCLAEGKDNATCEIECESKNGAGHAEFVPYRACGLLHCLAPCVPNFQVSPCTQCFYAACRDQAYACDSDSACDLLQSCRKRCLDRPDSDTCAAACNRSVDEGVKNKYDALMTCGLKYCFQACGDDADAGTTDPAEATKLICMIGSKTMHACCQLLGGSSCDTQEHYMSCCLGTTCPPLVARQIACLAEPEHNAFDTDSCAAALDACGVGSSI